MNTILPTGISRLNTASSKFNLESGSVIIGLNAGTQLEEINNVFVGNSAGSESTFVSESVFLGMFAGEYIKTGKKSIIIGHDTSSTYLNKTNILSIGFNNIEKESIGIGSNISCEGNNNVLLGRNISTKSYNSYAYGNSINIQSSAFFLDTLQQFDSRILLDGFNKIGLIDIITHTNFKYSNLFYIQYDINNYVRVPDTIFTRETEIIIKFKPTGDFNFNIGFYIDSYNLINFNIKHNMITYTNSETLLDFPSNQSISLNNAFIYGQYNTIHFINNDRIYKTLSIYVNPTYKGHTILNTSDNLNEDGFIANIRNNSINNIRIGYNVNNNDINSNYIFSPAYNSIYPDENNSNLRLDYHTFNNALNNISFKDFIVCINDCTAYDAYNICMGRDLNIKGAKNICIGERQSIANDNSILIGNDISANSFYQDSKDSIIIGNNNLRYTNSKDIILIGNNNLNTVQSGQSSTFTDKFPIIIGTDIDTYEYPLNIGNTICKYDVDDKQVLFAGLQDPFLPVAVGFSSNSQIPMKELYKFNYVSNIYYEYETSNDISNYYIDGIEYQEVKEYIITHEIEDIQITNNIALTDDKYALYVKNKIYTDEIGLYNSSNYSVFIKTDEQIKQNIKYSLPNILDADTYASKTPLLSYAYSGDSNALYWKTLEDTLRIIDIYSKNVITTGYIYSSDFVGVGSNLQAVSLYDRDTSLLREGSNLYFTSQRAGEIAHASNVKAMNYTLLASNEIMHQIQALNTNKIAESDNLYYTDKRFDDRLLTKTLDNIYIGTSNKYITNGIYTNDLLITGTLTVGKIQVLGIDFPKSMQNVAFASAADISVLSEQIRDLTQAISSIKSRIGMS